MLYKKLSADCARTVFQKLIPRGLNLLNYADSDIIHLITFQSYVNYYRMTVGVLKKNSNITGNGGTYMANVYEKVKSVSNSSGIEKNYRILVLSDGIISDQEKTLEEAEKIKNFVKSNNYSISVGSISIFLVNKALIKIIFQNFLKYFLEKKPYVQIFKFLYINYQIKIQLIDKCKNLKFKTFIIGLDLHTGNIIDMIQVMVWLILGQFLQY